MNRRGFTLLEVLLTMALLASIVGMVGGILLAILQSEKKANRIIHSQKVGAGIMNLITRDLQAVYAYDIASPLTDVDEADTDEIEFVVSLPPLIPPEGEALSGEEDLTTASPTGGLEAETEPTAPEPELLRIGYLLRRSEMHDRLFVLFRTESSQVQTGGGDEGQALPDPGLESELGAATGRRGMEIYDQIVSLSFEFYDEEEEQWVEHWEKTGSVPRAVRVELVAIPEYNPNLEGTEAGERRKKTYRTIVRIPVDNVQAESDEEEEEEEGTGRGGPGPRVGGR